MGKDEIDDQRCVIPAVRAAENACIRAGELI